MFKRKHTTSFTARQICNLLCFLLAFGRLKLASSMVLSNGNILHSLILHLNLKSTRISTIYTLKVMCNVSDLCTKVVIGVAKRKANNVLLGIRVLLIGWIFKLNLFFMHHCYDLQSARQIQNICYKFYFIKITKLPLTETYSVYQNKIFFVVINVLNIMNF